MNLPACINKKARVPRCVESDGYLVDPSCSKSWLVVELTANVTNVTLNTDADINMSVKEQGSCRSCFHERLFAPATN